MKKLLILLFGILIIGLVNAGTNGTAVDDEGNVYQCGTINESGSYVMNQSVSTTETCLIIDANNIILNGNGKTIAGDSVLEDFGIYIILKDNITIKNFKNITNFQKGIYLLGTSNSIINNLSTSFNTISGIHIVDGFIPSTQNNLSNITSNSNKYGIYLSHSSDNILSNIVTNSNTAYGIGIYDFDFLYKSMNNNLSNIASNSNKEGFYSTYRYYIIKDSTFEKNHKSVLFNLLSSSEREKELNSQINISFNTSYFDSSDYSYNVSIYPSTDYTINNDSNLLNISFIPTNEGIYSLKLSLNKSNNNIETRKYIFLVGNTFSDSVRYYMHSDEPSHGQPSAGYGTDSGSMFNYNTTLNNYEEEVRNCSEWVQYQPDKITNFYPIIKNISIGWLYKSSGSTKAGVQVYGDYSETKDYDLNLPATTNYIFNITNFTSINILNDYLRSFYFLSFKLSGSSPYVKSNVTQQSYADLTYLYAGARIEYLTEEEGSDIMDMEILSNVFNDDTNKSATLEFEGEGNFTIVLNMTTDNYHIKYDGVSCESNENCTINYNSNGIINLTLSLGSYHYLDIDTTSSYLVSHYQFNSNNGTIAYDSSGNSNHGTISGATWSNDGVLVSLVNGVDYTLNTVSGVLTMSSDYVYSWIEVAWNYDESANDTNSTIAHLIELFVAIGIIGFIVLIIKYYLEEIE